MGLIDSRMKEQPQQPSQELPPSEQSQEQPSQDHQPLYERIATMALGYVYSEPGTEMIQQGLRLEGADIIQNAGNIVAKILMRLIVTVRTQGGVIPPKVMLQVGMETSLAVLELAENDAELPNAKEGMLDAVFYAAVSMIGKELPEDILSAEERKDIHQNIQQLHQISSQPSTQQSN